MQEEPHTFISRSERLRLPRTLDSGRVARLRVFRSRITDWAEPSEVVYEEPVIVCVKVRRERPGARPKVVPPALSRKEVEEILKKKVTDEEWAVYKRAMAPIEMETAEVETVVWYDEFCIDHFHHRVVQFEDLLTQKKDMGYVIAVKDAVLAYMLIFEWGRKTVIAGFLSTFPEFKELPRLREMVGENLSRLHADGFIDVVPMPPKRPPPPPYYVPKPPEEALYMVNKRRQQIQLKRARWWEKGW